MTSATAILKKTQKMMGRFLKNAGRSVKSVATHPGNATKRVFKGATGAAGRAFKIAKNTATHPVRAVGKAGRSVRTTTRRVRRFIKF
jgi:hypothetical protein